MNMLPSNTNRNARVVDIGSGWGFKLFHTIEKKTENIYGVDKEDAVEFCKKTYTKEKFTNDNLENPQYKSNIPTHVEIIICSDVIEQLIDPDIMLAHINTIASSETLVLWTHWYVFLLQIVIKSRQELYGVNKNWTGSRMDFWKVRKVYKGKLDYNNRPSAHISSETPIEKH